MGRNHAVPTAKGLSPEEIRLLEALDEATPSTFAQQAVGRVVGALFYHHDPVLGSRRNFLARQVALSLGAKGKEQALVARGNHFIRMAAATGYVEGHGQNVRLTAAGRSLAERASAKNDQAAHAEAAKEQEVAAIAADLQQPTPG